MNTILITGTAKTIPYKISACTTGFKVQYDVHIWASKEGEQLQFITSKYEWLLRGHGDLWALVKVKVREYFKMPKFDDGAYTQFLDHLIII